MGEDGYRCHFCGSEVDIDDLSGDQRDWDTAFNVLVCGACLSKPQAARYAADQLRKDDAAIAQLEQLLRESS